jgi:hypothetical protein
MPNSIKIKFGPVEIEYEGDEKFSKDEISQMLVKISDLLKDPNIKKSLNVTSDPAKTDKPGSDFKGTVATFAAKLGGSSGPELAIATAAQLTIGEGFGTFTREQLLNGMRTASGYYKESYNKNLSSSLNSLIKAGKLKETVKGTYSLDAVLCGELRNKLVP